MASKILFPDALSNTFPLSVGRSLENSTPLLRLYYLAMVIYSLLCDTIALSKIPSHSNRLKRDSSAGFKAVNYLVMRRPHKLKPEDGLWELRANLMDSKQENMNLSSMTVSDKIYPKAWNHVEEDPELEMRIQPG